VSHDDYFIATDLDALRRESELLTLENTFLKGRVRQLEQDLREAQKDSERLRKELSRLRGDRAKAQSKGA
jgi:FtsZ-binding cell division protein ZapB